MAAKPPAAVAGEVGTAIARFYADLARLERDAYRAMLPHLDEARNRAIDALDEAYRRVDEHPDDPGYAFTAERLDATLRQIEDAYRAAGDAARGVAIDATTLASILGTDSANAAAGVYAPGWAVANIAQGQAVVAAATSGPFARVLASLGPDAAEAARRELVQGAILGQNPRKTARQMVAAADGLSKQRARTIARTETLRAFRAASLDRYRQHGDLLHGWTWHSALDRRTCAACWAMHGTVHPLDEAMAAHVNCRCRALPVPDLGEEETKAYLAALNGPKTKGGTGPQGGGFRGTPGEHAFTKLPEADKRTVLGPSRYRLYKARKATLQQMTGRADSPVWGSSVYVKPLTPSQRAWLASDATAPTRPTRPRRAAPPRKPPRAAPTRRVDAAPQVNASTVATPRMRDAEQRRTVTDALRAVPHRLPADAPRFDVERLAADANALGDYTHGSHRIRIRFNRSPWEEPYTTQETIWHEFGHYVDYAILRRGTARTPGGIGDDHATVMRLLRDSATARAIRTDLPPGRYRTYFASDAELFARAYAQWVGTRSGAEGYARYRAWALTQRDTSRHSAGLGVWRDDEFNDIAEAFDALFRNRGWLT